MRQKEKKEANLGEDRIGGLLFKLALPAILAQVINLLYNLVAQQDPNLWRADG